MGNRFNHHSALDVISTYTVLSVQIVRDHVPIPGMPGRYEVKSLSPGKLGYNGNYQVWYRPDGFGGGQYVKTPDMNITLDDGDDGGVALKFMMSTWGRPQWPDPMYNSPVDVVLDYTTYAAGVALDAYATVDSAIGIVSPGYSITLTGSVTDPPLGYPFSVYLTQQPNADGTGGWNPGDTLPDPTPNPIQQGVSAPFMAWPPEPAEPYGFAAPGPVSLTISLPSNYMALTGDPNPGGIHTASVGVNYVRLIQPPWVTYDSTGEPINPGLRGVNFLYRITPGGTDGTLTGKKPTDEDPKLALSLAISVSGRRVRARADAPTALGTGQIAGDTNLWIDVCKDERGAVWTSTDTLIRGTFPHLHFAKDDPSTLYLSYIPDPGHGGAKSGAASYVASVDEGKTWAAPTVSFGSVMPRQLAQNDGRTLAMSSGGSAHFRFMDGAGNVLSEFYGPAAEGMDGALLPALGGSGVVECLIRNGNGSVSTFDYYKAVPQAPGTYKFTKLATPTTTGKSYPAFLALRDGRRLMFWLDDDTHIKGICYDGTAKILMPVFTALTATGTDKFASFDAREVTPPGGNAQVEMSVRILTVISHWSAQASSAGFLFTKVV